jgi:hypothetical protein
MQWCEGKNEWTWASQQRTSAEHCGVLKEIYLDFPQPAIYDIQFSMREDGFEFDKFILTNDIDFVPLGTGPAVKVSDGKLPDPFPKVAQSRVQEPESYFAQVAQLVEGVESIEAHEFPTDGTRFYKEKKWLAINPNKYKNATTSIDFPFEKGRYDIIFVGVGENDGRSGFQLLIDNEEIGKYEAPLSERSFEEGFIYNKLWKNIEINKGDQITVIASVGSKDGSEYSRGRWSGVLFAPLSKGKWVMEASKSMYTKQDVGSTPITSLKMEQPEAKVIGELKKWHKITFAFEGPNTAEKESFNPFMNYRLNVTFTHPSSEKEYKVPGYFAADGDAGTSSASEGNVWKVHFSPDEIGKWNYTVDFRKGKWVAVSEYTKAGESGEFMDGLQGSFEVGDTDKKGNDFRAKGRLQYVGERYLQFSETGEYFLKSGPDSPENLFAYEDFDGTFHGDGHKDDLVKTWKSHINDWEYGDPTWKGNKGKGLVGALNYIASEGQNSISFLTFNIRGDDQNVFPFVDYDTYDRYDGSKLDQWEMVVEHAQKLGLFLHFKTQEVENQGLLDGGALGATRRLYYRELIARFGHHNALNWNMGEEDGEWMNNPPTPPQYTHQRLGMAQYFFDNDPYHHHEVIHNGVMFDDILGKESKYSGVSLQTHHSNFRLVHPGVLEWLKKSEKSGKQWAVAVDEPGDAGHALLPDADDPAHDVVRQEALWGALMAGSWGLEWYFGYKHAHSDLSCEDWRSRDLFWDQCRIALNLFNSLPFNEMTSRDELLNTKDYCFAKEGEIYVVYLRKGNKTELDLSEASGRFEASWYNPRTGEYLKKTKKLNGGDRVALEAPKKGNDEDWAIILKVVQ